MRKLNLAQLRDDSNVIEPSQMYLIRGGDDIIWIGNYLYNVYDDGSFMYSTDLGDTWNDPLTDVTIPSDDPTYNGGTLPTVVINGGYGGQTLPEVIITAPSPFNSPWSWWVRNPYVDVGDSSGYYSSNEQNYGGNIISSTTSGPNAHVAVGLEYARWLVSREIPYAQQYGDLRTDNTFDALAYMDCSEFVCRYFAAMGFISNSVQSMNTLALRQYAEDNPGMLSRVPDEAPPQAGDIFLWHRSDDDGHTGIVQSYNPNTGMVTILEEYSYGDVHEAREIEYGIKSGALKGHDGWEGFYRPNVN